MKPLIFAGPCGVLPYDQMAEEVEFLEQFKNDCDLVIRGGAYKGQLYPGRKMVNGKWVNTDQEYVGLEEKGVEILEAIQTNYGINCCTEVMATEHVTITMALGWVQTGTRHMGNLPLLRALRHRSGNVLLKRGMGNTITEWLGAAEHVMHESNNRIVLCERGIVTFECTDPRIRWRPDILAIPQIKADTEHKIILDCSHSTGRRDLVLPMARAAMACGADGIMVEVMSDPTQSATDAAQGVDHEGFLRIMEAIL